MKLYYALGQTIAKINQIKVSSFDEALQRILFYNQLLWQTGHKLMGLGRLDKVLYEYYINDINSNVITKETAKETNKNNNENNDEDDD